jgi:epoxyqueuosine reductase
VDIGDWLFGCDECLLVCPFHQKAPACANRHFRFYPDRARLNLRELLEMNAGTFEARFHDSPIKKPGLETLRRNAQMCLQPFMEA